MDALFLLGNPEFCKNFRFTVSEIRNDYSVEYFQELELSEGCLEHIQSKVNYAKPFSSFS